ACPTSRAPSVLRSSSARRSRTPARGRLRSSPLGRGSACRSGTSRKLVRFSGSGAVRRTLFIDFAGGISHVVTAVSGLFSPLLEGESMKRTLRWLVMVALIAGAGSVSAQTRIMVGGGLLMPMGNYKDLDKMGFLGQAGVGFPVGPVGIRIEGDYGQTSHK